MLKKVILGVGAVLLLSTFVFGRDVFSYLRTGFRSARESLKAEVPIEFELQRARDMVGRLLPDIRKCMHVIAEEEVQVDHLSKSIAKCETELGRQKGEILALRKDVGGGRGTYQYAGRVYTPEEVQRDLAQRFERFKTAEATLGSKRQILTARQKSLVAAREKLEGMISSKRDLEVQIENIEARMKMIEAVQTANHVQVDDSQLARAKQLVGELNRQLDVQQKMMDAEGNFTGLIPVEASRTVPTNLSQQIDEYFQPGSDSLLEKSPTVTMKSTK